jgi:hypothetical protein
VFNCQFLGVGELRSGSGVGWNYKEGWRVVGFWDEWVVRGGCSCEVEWSKVWEGSRPVESSHSSRTTISFIKRSTKAYGGRYTVQSVPPSPGLTPPSGPTKILSFTLVSSTSTLMRVKTPY